METSVLLGAGGIFVLRLIGNMLTTVRLVLMVRGRKLTSSVMGAFEALIFALALGSVVTNLDNMWNLGAYCIGYAVGGYLGLSLEQRLITRFVAVWIISPQNSKEVAAAIRKAGYGATESWGRGASGAVGSVTAVVAHREVEDVIAVVKQVDPQAFVTLEELRGISQGHFRRLARPER